MELADRAARQRYAQLIAQCLRPVPVFQAIREDENTLQVERGLMLAMAVWNASDFTGIASACDRLLESGAVELRVIDAAGHRRSHYPGLLLHAWRRTLAQLNGLRTPPPHSGGWAEGIERWRASLTATDDAVGRTWAAHARGEPESASSFQQLIDGQQSSGALLKPDPSQNPETLWYEELVLLHALTAYAVCSGNPKARAAASRAAEHHLNETQPDHATSEPWGLLAFILNPNTRSLADQMLHTVQVLHPNGATGVTAILLADVLDCLRELDRDFR
jgi:hypothetical protein